MSNKARRIVIAVLVCMAPSAARAATVDFTAVEEAGHWRHDWNWALFSGEFSGTPDASQSATPSSGIQNYWSLVYDGSNALTYSWGTAPGSYTNSIAIALGPEDFDYLTISTNQYGNRRQTVSVENLVLKTDLGILKGDSLFGDASGDNSYTFSYADPAVFGAFTLTGTTTFTWQNNYNANHLAVLISGGNSSPVVPEPMSASILFMGLAMFIAKAARGRSHARKLTPMGA